MVVMFSDVKHDKLLENWNFGILCHRHSFGGIVSLETHYPFFHSSIIP
jgi:hypothetical protein